MALTDLFTNIANAIRLKDDTIEPIVANDFAQRILDIPTGGNPDCVYGTFMLAEDVPSILTVEHNADFIPRSVIIWTEDISTVNLTDIANALLTVGKYKCYFFLRTYAAGSNPQSGSDPSINEAIINITDTTFDAVTPYSNYYFRSGLKYNWVVIR